MSDDGNGQGGAGDGAKDPQALYDHEGNPVEGALAPEKAKELQETLQTKEAELEKLSSKEFNFSKFREAKEDEKKKILEGFSEKEQTMIKEIDKLRSENEGSHKKTMEAAEQSVLDSLVGDDKDLREKIIETSKTFVGEATTPDELKQRYHNAYVLLNNERPKVNSMNRFAPITQGYEPSQAPGYVRTPEGKATYKGLFGHEPGGLGKKKE